MTIDTKSPPAAARALASAAQAKSHKAKRKPPMPSAARSRILQTFSQLDDTVLLTEQEAADVAGISAQCLKRWRNKQPGKAPTPVNLHGRVRYPVKAIRAWIAS